MLNILRQQNNTQVFDIQYFNTSIGLRQQNNTQVFDIQTFLGNTSVQTFISGFYSSFSLTSNITTQKLLSSTLSSSSTLNAEILIQLAWLTTQLPRVTTRNINNFIVTGKLNTAGTVYALIKRRLSAVPTISEIVNVTGSNIISSGNDTVSAGEQFSITLSVSGQTDPTFDIYLVGVGGTNTEVYSLLNQVRLPPSGKQYSVINVPWPAEMHSILLGLSPDAADNDILEVDTITLHGKKIYLSTNGTYRIE